MHELRGESMHIGDVELTLLRPIAPEALIDEKAFADDEFLPYWAELWPAATALALTAEVRDWRDPWEARFDLALAADVLYERRNVEPLLARLRDLAPEALVGLAGRPYESEFLRQAGEVEQVAERVVRLRRAS